MHEYGHYLQSQSMGWAYLFKVGLPSFFSAKNSRENYAYREYLGEKIYLSSHKVHNVEMAANRETAYYFHTYYGVAWNGYKYIYYPLSWDDIILNYTSHRR
jgi:hypothetical protein